MNKKYITTAIDYPNGKPHIGHAYEKTLADFYRRYYRNNGYETYLVTGTDENGQKLAVEAKKNKKDTKKYIDENVIFFKNLCKNLDINYDFFIRTSSESHKKEVLNIWSVLKKKNLIYKKNYEGEYCYGCESFILDKDKVDGLCPNHKDKLSYKKESGYFFKLSNFEKQIIEIIDKGLIKPEYRKIEILNRIKEDGLKDISITRENSYNWGIKVPDENLVFYTWFDALINYYTAGKEHWSPDIQIIGKDILWFHSVIWLALLIACEKEIPKELFVHGIITDKDGKKLSKSLGNYIDIDKLLSKYPADLIRYYFLYKISDNQDGKFNEEELSVLYKSDFVQGIGNLYSRITSLIEKKNINKFDLVDNKNIFFKEKLKKELGTLIDQRAHNKYVSYLLEKVGEINKYISDNKPWSLCGYECNVVLATALFNFRILLDFYEPIIPETVDKIKIKLSSKEIKFDGHLF